MNPLFKRSFLFFVLTVILLLPRAGWADDWPQWRGPERDGVWREDRIVRRFDEPQLTPEWEFAIGPGYAGPTVADGRVYVMDRQVQPEQEENVYCLDTGTGRLLWKHSYPCPYRISYDAGPRACVTVTDGRAYALGAMGHLHCLDAGTGVVLWQRDLNEQYRIAESQRMPQWGIAAAPLVHDDLVIVQIGGADQACVVAFDRKNGDERWRALRDRASYSAPIIVKQNGTRIVVCWTGDSVAGLRPQDGQLLWRHPFPPRQMPIGVATPAVSGDRLFVTSFYDGSLMLRLHPDAFQVSEVWKRAGFDERNTDALHSIISTPVFESDYIYGVDSHGELRCLEAESGRRIWEDQTATPPARWSTIHFVKNGDRYFLFNERGELLIARLTPQGFQELDRAQLIQPTRGQLNQRGGVCWAHPAFADRHVFIRNDEKLICVDLEAD